jgi:hypothetical protein
MERRTETNFFSEIPTTLLCSYIKAKTKRKIEIAPQHPIHLSPLDAYLLINQMYKILF